MSFLLPTARPNPSGIARLGRLLQWCAFVLAALLLALAWGAWTQVPIAPTLANPYPNHGLPAETFAVFAVVVALIGRGARYLLAGE